MQCGHIPTVKLLLERGATVDYRQPHGGNVFHVVRTSLPPQPSWIVLHRRLCSPSVESDHSGDSRGQAAQLGREEAGQVVLEAGAKSGLPTLMALITMKDKQ